MASFKRSLSENIPQLRRYARALVADKNRADDLVQDCLERAWRKQSLWDSKLPMRPWLFTIMHNIYVNNARQYYRSPQLISIEDIHEHTQTEDQEQKLVLRDFSKALNLLEQKHREVLLLVGLEQLSYKDTAEILNIPIGTVMSRLSRAREQLSQHMNQQAQSNIRRIK